MKLQCQLWGYVFVSFFIMEGVVFADFNFKSKILELSQKSIDLQNDGKWDEAEAVIRQAEKIDPQLAQPSRIVFLVRKGWQYFVDNKESLALNSFNEVLRIDPHDTRAHDGVNAIADKYSILAWEHFHKGDLVGALKLFRNSIAIKHDHAESKKGISILSDHFEEKGWIHYYKFHYDEAILFFENALSLQPHRRKSLEGLVWCYFQKKEFDRAATLADQIYYQDPKDVEWNRFIELINSKKLKK